MKRLEMSRTFQDAGDELRKADRSSVAMRLMLEIKRLREQAIAKKQTETAGVVSLPQVEVKPPIRIYIVDSLKNPAEVELLRGVYRESFCLIGVVCEAQKRQERLQHGKCSDSSEKEILAFMKRDEDDGEKYGQKVADTFQMADFFVDNTPDRFLDKNKTQANKDWVVNDKISRLFEILTGERLIRPEPSETGMFFAKGAQLRSACLSRQVGAALTDSHGNIIATGTNEVPMPSGGVYGNSPHDEHSHANEDHRCFVHRGFCSNTRVQTEIINEVIDAIPQLEGIGEDVRQAIAKSIKKTPVGRLIEFSRAVHAEMDALLSAARVGASTVGSRLYVTTFPCHYCARHIVTAGVDEVQYIEPYPKSRAFELHDDALQPSAIDWRSPSKFKKLIEIGVSDGEQKGRKSPPKVLLRAFTGVAPRMYRRAFMKDVDLKDSSGNMAIGEPEWARGLLHLSYLDVERHLEKAHV